MADRFLFHSFSTLLLSLALIQSAHATISFSEISGASVSDLNEDDSSVTNPDVFGGGANAGACTTADLDDELLCNTCTGIVDVTTLNTANGVCNQRAVILGTTYLNITFSATTAGFAAATNSDGDEISGTEYNSPNSISAGSSITVSIPWSSICSDSDITGSDTGDGCEDGEGFVGSIRVGVAPDGNRNLSDSGADYSKVNITFSSPNTFISGSDCTSDSLCDVDLFPGDQKVYIDGLAAGDGFPLVDDPSNASISISRIALFYSSLGFSSTYPGAAEGYAFLDILDEGASSTPDTVDGLQNDVLYFFRYAGVDEAGNIMAFADPANENSSGGIDSCSAIASSMDLTSCSLAVTPSKVIGLLAEDANCFITTAAYGSSWHGKVVDFRQFRNKVLLRSEFGRKVITWYYEYGPYGARAINTHPWLKPFTKAALYPLWLFSKLSLLWGFMPTLLGTLLFGFLCFMGLSYAYQPEEEDHRSKN